MEENFQREFLDFWKSVRVSTGTFHRRKWKSEKGRCTDTIFRWQKVWILKFNEENLLTKFIQIEMPFALNLKQFYLFHIQIKTAFLILFYAFKIVRQCLGEPLARMELFLFTANLLHRYTVRKFFIVLLPVNITVGQKATNSGNKVPDFLRFAHQ